jgi:hypothetical protein
VTEYQLLTNIKSKLVARTWTGSSNVVFPTGSVAISSGRDLWFLSTLRCPIAIIKPGGTESDPEFDEEPGFLRFSVGLRLVTDIPNDWTGEAPLIGANKTQGSTRSEGRGIFEIEQEVFNAIGILNALESVDLQCTQRSEVEIDQVGSVMVAYRDYTFQCYGTAV